MTFTLPTLLRLQLTEANPETPSRVWSRKQPNRKRPARMTLSTHEEIEHG
jgi:hypothetical protein